LFFEGKLIQNLLEKDKKVFPQFKKQSKIPFTYIYNKLTLASVATAE